MASDSVDNNEKERYYSQSLLESGERSDSDKSRTTYSSLSLKKNNLYEYFCDWYPELFGIDEDLIPDTEDEEGLFDDLDLDEDLEERAQALQASDLEYLRVGSREFWTEEELKVEWKKDQIPRYGRRARQKPILFRENHTKFECVCDIDRSYSRHYIPHFGGGVKKISEEWRTPHFKVFWENYRDETENEEWQKIFEKKHEEETEQEKNAYFRPLPKFPGNSKKDLQVYWKQLLSSFRPLTCREIRRYRMPFAEAVYLELQEDNYKNTAAFFKRILIKDHNLHQNSQFTGPLLRNSRSKLNKLVAFLKIAERFARKKNFPKEVTTLLRSGKYFNEHSKDWWWLAEEFYLEAVKVSQKSVIDGGKSEAIARYILGTFLLDCVSKVQLAQEHLSKAREISLGKDWIAGKILNKIQKPLYKECGNDLCRALIAASKELRKNGKPEEALPLIHRSHKICRDSGASQPEVEMETYFELGMTYQAVGMVNWAKVAFRKFIEIARIGGHPKSVCDGYLELAICFRSEGDLIRCHHSLVNYLKTAKMNFDENLTAFGHRYLGEFHLNNGNSKEAADFFRKAFTSFHTQCQESLNKGFNKWETENYHLPQDVELARVLVGLAVGEMLTKPICHLILQARDAKNQTEAHKLMEWKNSRVIQSQEEEARDSKVEENIDIEPYENRIQLGKGSESEGSSEEILGESSEFRQVRFAVDEKKSAIIL